MPSLPLISVILLVVWIFLIYSLIVVRKKKTKIFHDQMDPELAERRYKKLNTFLLVAIISLPVWIVGMVVVIAYNPSGIMEIVAGIILGLAFVGFVIAIIGSLVIFRKGRRKTT